MTLADRSTRARRIGFLLVLAAAAANAQEPATGDATVPADPVPAAPDERARRDAARQTFDRLMEEKRYEEAAEIASQVVELSSGLDGPSSVDLADAFANLATAHLRLGNLTAAEREFGTAVSLVERVEGPASPRLIEPLMGLGEVFMRGGLYPQANAVYQRALRLSHAEAGFYDEGQLPILDGLSESYLGMDKLPDANARQRIQVAIARRRAGDDEAAVTPALYKLGRWYKRTGQYPAAREAYQEARRIVRETKGETDPAIIDALLGEAQSYADEGAAPASVSTLRRALDILDRQPQPEHRRRAEVLVALGDLYLVYRRPATAREQYARAWSELSADESLLERRDEYFDRPFRLSGPRLPAVVDSGGREQAAGGAASALESGIVAVKFSVDTDGAARDPAVIESSPPGLLDEKVLKAVSAAVFRPRLVDGAAVMSDTVQFRHEFRYPKVPTREGEPPAGAPAGERGEAIGYPESPADDAGP